MNLVDRSSLRHLSRHPWLGALLIVGIAVGVAAVVAIDLAIGSAHRALQISLDNTLGHATHQIIAGPHGLDESIYRKIRVEAGCRRCAPVIDTYGRMGELVVHIIGVDPFAEGGVRPHVEDSGAAALRRLLGEPGTALMSAALSRVLNTTAGDAFDVQISGRNRQLTMAGLLYTPVDSARSLENLLIVDLATAQEMTGLIGRLTRIDLRIDNDDDLVRLAQVLPADAHIVTTAARGRAATGLSASFEINLQAMSLLAVVVGMFLIYNSMSFAVLQRREWIGSLRALGVTRRHVFMTVLKEALAAGLLGSVIGIAGGWFLGQTLLHIVTRTISDHYFIVTVTQAIPSLVSLVKGLLLGITATVTAAALPALDAARTPPRATLRRSTLEIRTHAMGRKMAISGAILIAVAMIVQKVATDDLVTGFVSLFLVMLGITATAPLAASFLTSATLAVAGTRLGVQVKMALRGVVAQSSRTGIALAALMLAMAAAVGISIMVHSFRLTVDQWLTDTLQADIYVSLPGPRGAAAQIEPALLDRFRQLPPIAAYSTGRRIVLDDDGSQLQLFALGLSAGLVPRYQIKDGQPEQVWASFLEDRAVLISEPLAFRRHLRVGDYITLPTDYGRHAFRIAGIYFDYSSEHGEVLIHRSFYDRHFADRGIGGIGLYITAGADLDAALSMVHRVVTRHNPHQQLLVRANREIRSLSLAIFDRTFAVTEVLRLLAILVAMVGIVSALMALNLERAREYSLLRALGFTPVQIWTMALGQSAYIGLVAGLLALPAGFILAELLIHVINQRAFGWSMQFHIPSASLIQAIALAVIAATVAALYPGWKIAHTPPATGLREE